MNKSAETNRVFVLSSTRKPLMPCHPARARELLCKGRASVFRKQPFTIIIHDRDDGDTQQTHICIDPGSKTTGMAIRIKGKRGWRCVFGMELIHRKQAIKSLLADRRMYRRNRRGRNIRYRPPRFNNRRKPEGWLAPSLRHIVDTTLTWTDRLGRLAPVTDIYIESTKFDPHKAYNSDIQAKGYQQGRNYGWRHFRDRLLYEAKHTCQYCYGASGSRILELDHVIPRSQGGTDNEDNLVVACRKCNQDKGNLTPEQWLNKLTPGNKRDKVRCKGIQHVLTNHKVIDRRDMAAMNATSKQLRNALIDTGIPVTETFATDTKYNRTQQGYRKTHWIDAACVGEPDFKVYLPHRFVPLRVKSMGYGRRQVQRTDKYGFPVGKPRKGGRTFGFKTGDLVYVDHPKFTSLTRAQSVKADGRISVIMSGGKSVEPNYKYFKLAQYADGYRYTYDDDQHILFELDEDTKVGVLRYRGYRVCCYRELAGRLYVETINTSTR